MSLNCAEIDLILSELNLQGCFIQKIRQPDFESLIFELYRPGDKRFSVGFYLGHGKTAVLPIMGKPPADGKPQRFVQFLKSRIDGGRIEESRQIDFNRIIWLKIVRGGTVSNLYVRLWSGAANILAVDEKGIILDAFYRRPNKKEIGGEPLILPPASTDSGKFVPRSFDGDGTFGEQAAAFYGRKTTPTPNVERLRSELKTPVEARLEQLRRLAEKLLPETQFDALHCSEKQAADLLLSLPPQPAGAASVTVETPEGRKTEITLDPRLTSVENSREYYKRYKKKKAAAAAAALRLNEIQTEAAALKTELSFFETAADEEILQHGALKKTHLNATEKKLAAGFPTFISGDRQILVGRSGKENDELLRFHVKGNDWWLHTRDVPGGYVFIKNGKKETVPQEVLLDAAQLAKWFSKAKNHAAADLYCTQVKYLRRAKNGPLGTVLPFHEKNIFVKEDRERLKRLLGKNLL